jgi:hypothetical protein
MLQLTSLDQLCPTAADVPSDCDPETDTPAILRIINADIAKYMSAGMSNDIHKEALI